MLLQGWGIHAWASSSGGVPLGAECSSKMTISWGQSHISVADGRLVLDMECAGVSESPGIQRADPVCPRPCCRVSQCWSLTGVY